METDTQIFRNLVAQFKSSPLLHYAKFEFLVQDGIVTIFGQVNSLAHRRAAERVANRVAGIKTLILEIRASPIPITMSRIPVDMPKGTPL